MNELKISCCGTHVAELDKFKLFDSNIKKHSLMELARLENLIKRDGLLAPFSVVEIDGIYNIIDGESRYRIICDLKNQGYSIPPLPFVLVKTNNPASALLSLQCQFHCIPETALRKFEAENDVSLSDYQFLDCDIIQIHPPVDVSIYFRDLRSGKHDMIGLKENDFKRLI